MENEECEKIIDVFKKAGMRINIGENYSVKGQIAQLLNGVKELPSVGISGLRTFEHFPDDLKCPVCNTNKDGLTILVEIDGTEDGKNCEAVPLHLKCAVAQRYNKEHKMLYTKHT